MAVTPAGILGMAHPGSSMVIVLRERSRACSWFITSRAAFWSAVKATTSSASKMPLLLVSRRAITRETTAVNSENSIVPSRLVSKESGMTVSRA